ncbi:MAG: CBS domain-containing protein [Candidatus Omnitrophica bacterium]|nr:CBS domain-containing protein [Candidatus Omnitrophota bacterium]MBU1925583.1 CBS domain-containing protein [Candidatus Omnitrophota bacterium]MBU2064169.1 CBS domain-containing protein [Candidatus Omnitrophota bacterium]
MQIKDIMQTKVVSVRRALSLTKLLGLFREFHSFPFIPVVDGNNTLIGVVHIRGFFDIFKPYHENILMRNPLSLVAQEDTDIFDVDIEEGMGSLIIVADIMDKKVVKIEENQDLKEAYELIQLNKCEMIAVVDAENKLTGIISMFDIVMAVSKEKGLI